MKVHRLIGELESAPGGRLPAFLDGLRCVQRSDGALEVAFHPPVDVALPELLSVPGLFGSWDVDGGVLVAGRVPYLVNRPPDPSTCLVMAAKQAGLGLEEATRLLGLDDRLLDGCALDLRDWAVADPAELAEQTGLAGAWHHCLAQLGIPEPHSSANLAA